MKRDIKPHIRAAAEALFQAQGFINVSMRDVASAAGISVGNLTYHYKKKEDLIEAVVLEHLERFCLPQPAGSVRELNDLLLKLSDRLHENAAYILSMRQILPLYPGIERVQRKQIRAVRKVFAETFVLLRKAGEMEPESYAGQYEQIAENLRILGAFWLMNGHLAFDVRSRAELLDCQWSVIRPLLTDRGEAAYRFLPPCQPSPRAQGDFI